MKHIFKFLLIIFFANITCIYASDDNSINEIEVNGIQRIDSETVVAYAKIELGEIYTDEIGNEVLKKLFETDLFSNIEISFIKNVLIINVVENPTINLVQFKGNSKIKDDDLFIEISLKERSVYSRSKVKKDIERMLTLYQRSGRLSTEIVPTVELLDNNRINLTYQIEESDIAEVSKIIVLGNEVYSSSKIKSIMKTKEKRFLRFLTSADRYDPDKLEYDKQLITQFYYDNGYPDFKFITSIAQLTPNSNNFEIILTVDEGKKYSVGRIDVTNELQKLNSKQIKKSLPIVSGDIYNASKIRDSVEGIKNIADLQGYTFIEIEPNISKRTEEQLIDIDFVINEGPRVYINSINIAGNTRTVDKVIRREISLSEGDAYNKYAISYSEDSIKSLNFFSEVSINDRRTEFSDKINLDVTVEEKNTGEASLGAGYSSASKASIQLGLKESNFLGRGQKVNLSTSFSDTNTLYDISFTEPYFRGKPLSLTTSVYSSLTDSGSVNYETEDFGFATSLKFPLSSDKSLQTRYSIFTTKIKADANATSYERLLAGTDTISILGYSFNFDKRNSRYKPSSGFNVIVDQDLAGLGGTSYYIKNKFQFNSYKRLSKDFIGAFKFQAGNVNGYNSEYAPLSSNFKLGGKRLRGFKSGKIGPRTGNSYTGGQYYYLTSLETNIDLNLDAYDITSTLFVDAGSVWGLENPVYSTIVDDHEIRSSLGVNFNWDSAVGPINIVYARILASESTDTTDNLYFDIGYNF